MIGLLGHDEEPCHELDAGMANMYQVIGEMDISCAQHILHSCLRLGNSLLCEFCFPKAETSKYIDRGPGFQ